LSFLIRYRALILVVSLLLALFVASPVIEQFVVAPKTEPLTEMSLLGPYYNASYPFNLTSGDVYPFYLTVSNHLGSSAYYLIEVKFRNQSQSGPDSFNDTASSLPSLANFTLIVDNDQSHELPVNFTFNYQVNPNLKATNLNNITVNESTIDTDNLLIPWDSPKNAYLGNLFFELYIYNNTIGSFQYHQRYVSLWLNLS
jgi:hypothetical protein